MKKITARMLRLKGACADHVAIFRREWPAGTTITLTSVRRAQKLDLDLAWFARQFFTASAWAEYAKARASAWAEYEKAIASAWAEYEKAIAPAWAEYAKAIASARAEYEKAIASAFVAAWRASQKEETKR